MAVIEKPLGHFHFLSNVADVPNVAATKKFSIVALFQMNALVNSHEGEGIFSRWKIKNIWANMILVLGM